MTGNKDFDVIIVGGSYSGLAAGMALGRSLKQVLIIDSGKPCNRQTPHSHNFITHDGRPPGEIAALARDQVAKYDTVHFLQDVAMTGTKTEDGFSIQTASGESFRATKLIFATGIKDILPNIEGIAACWGISVIHCPYCHGYEVRHEKTGVLSNGEAAVEFCSLLLNWTKDLTLFTNGPSTLTAEQVEKLKRHNIKITETEIEKLEHTNGYIQNIRFRDGTATSVKALYARGTFEQHCTIPQTLGCELTGDGYIKIDAIQMTTVAGVYACGDNVTRMRTVSNAVAMGATAGMMANKDLIFEGFQ